MTTMIDENETRKIQADYDELLRLHGRSAPRAMEGEGPTEYRRRMAEKLQECAPDCKFNIRHSTGTAFDVLEKQIQEAARREALHPSNIPDGELREVIKVDKSGRPFSTFFGKPSSWMNQFTTGAVRGRLIGIRTETQRGYRPGNLG
jgi:hypothetical protein